MNDEYTYAIKFRADKIVDELHKLYTIDRRLNELQCAKDKIEHDLSGIVFINSEPPE